MKGPPKRRPRQPLVLRPTRPLGARAGLRAANQPAKTNRPPVDAVRPVAGGVRSTGGRPRPGSVRKGGLPKFARVAFMIVFAYLLASFVFQEFDVWSLARQVRQLEDQAALLETENERLTEEIKYAQTPEYIERIAREELGLVWPNEIPYAPGRWVPHPAGSSTTGGPAGDGGTGGAGATGGNGP